MKETTIRILKRLLDEETVRASDISRTAQAEIQPLLSSGTIRQEHLGGGSRYYVVDRQAVAGVLEASRPAWEAPQGTPPRATAVRHRRDAKRGEPDTPTAVLLRSCRDSNLWSDGQNSLDVAALTRTAGVAAFAITPGDKWYSHDTLGMVENKEVFFNCHKLYRSTECGAFLYYGGNVATRLAEWLASRRRAQRILFYPDYDPVGLSNFVTLKQTVGSSVQLVVPEELEELLRRWGKQSLLSNNVAYLRNLTRCDDKTVQQVVDAMQRQGCGLEQEILLTLS